MTFILQQPPLSPSSSSTSPSIGEPFISSSLPINCSPKLIIKSNSTPSSFLHHSNSSSSRKMGRHKHPLLITTSNLNENDHHHQRTSPQSADASIVSMFSQSFLMNEDGEPIRRRTLEDREQSIIRRKSVSPARSISKKGERDYSLTYVQGQIDQSKHESEDEEQDADSLEARLRFPTFARRPLTFEGGNQKRKHSPVRSPLTVNEISYQGQQILGDDRDDQVKVGDIRWRDTENKPGDRDQSFTDEEEVLFSLDEEVSTEGLSSHLDDNEVQYESFGDEEAVELDEGTPSSLPLSLPFSYSAYSNRRVSDHSSAADLDMIWDEEEEDGLVSAPNLRTKIEELPAVANKQVPHNSVGGGESNAALLRAKREQPIAIVGGFDHRDGENGMESNNKQKSSSADAPMFRRSYFRKPLVQRSNSTPRNNENEIDLTILRRLSFARRPIESQTKLSSPSSNSLSSQVNLTSPSPPTMAFAHRESARRMSIHNKK